MKEHDKNSRVKEKLNIDFDMKDFCTGINIMGMIIKREMKRHFKTASPKPYLEKLVSKYGDLNSKVVTLPDAPHFVLSKAQCR